MASFLPEDFLARFLSIFFSLWFDIFYFELQIEGRENVTLFPLDSTEKNC